MNVYGDNAVTSSIRIARGFIRLVGRKIARLVSHVILNIYGMMLYYHKIFCILRIIMHFYTMNTLRSIGILV